MALIKCPECGNQISDKAESCPKCGYELNKKETPTTSDNKVASSFMNKGNIKYILIILAIIVAGFLFLIKIITILEQVQVALVQEELELVVLVLGSLLLHQLIMVIRCTMILTLEYLLKCLVLIKLLQTKKDIFM